MTSSLSLTAWRPWQQSLAAFRYLACLNSPGEFAHWRIYWAGALTFLKTVRDVLDRIDRKKSPLHSKIIHDLLKDLAVNKDLNPIYWKFVCKERDSLVHEFALGVQELSVTTRPFLVDMELRYPELAKKYGEQKMLIWGDDGEDGLRLLELAIHWWERNLRVIEEALKLYDEQPFSSGWRHREELMQGSLKYISLFNYDWEKGSAMPSSLPSES